MKSTPINSIRSLARHLKRDEKAVRSWLKDERWTFARVAPWKVTDLAAMDAWRKANLEQQPDDVDTALAGLSTERKAKLRLVVERTLKVRLERELLAGEFLKRSDVRADLMQRAGEAKQTMMAITSLSPRLVGRSEDEIRRLLAEHVETACNAIAEGGRA